MTNAEQELYSNLKGTLENVTNAEQELYFEGNFRKHLGINVLQ